MIKYKNVYTQNAWYINSQEVYTHRVTVTKPINMHVVQMGIHECSGLFQYKVIVRE